MIDLCCHTVEICGQSDLRERDLYIFGKRKEKSFSSRHDSAAKLNSNKCVISRLNHVERSIHIALKRFTRTSACLSERRFTRTLACVSERRSSNVAVVKPPAGWLSILRSGESVEFDFIQSFENT